MITPSHKETGIGNHALLPWLWVWLIIYLFSLPNLFAYIWETNLKDFFVNRLGILQELNPFYRLIILSNIVELAPFVVIFLGVVMVLFPQIRAFFVEWIFRLKVPDEISKQALREITAFLSEYMPNLQVRVNLLRNDQTAFTYPLSYRTYAIAVFGGLIILWRKDKAVAQALLLHEIAHCKQGDVLIVGSGSLLQWLLNHWITLYVLTAFLPLMLTGGYEIFNAWQQFGELRLDVWFGNHEIGQLLRNNLWLTIAGDLIISVTVMLYTAWILILPLVGIWSSEVNADLYVCENFGMQGEMLRAVESLKMQKTSIWLRLFTRMSHPPVAARAWAVKQYRNPAVWIILVLSFPLAYILKLLLNIIVTVGEFWSPAVDWQKIGQTLQEGIKISLSGTIPIWVGMLLLILLWPILAPYWNWFFAGKRGEPDWSRYRQNLVSAFTIGILVVSAYGIANTGINPSPLPADPTPEEYVDEFKIGDVIPATGLQVTVLGWNEVRTDTSELAPKAGNKYLAVDLIVVKIGTETRRISAEAQMTLVDKKGKEYRIDPTVNVILDKPTPDGMMLVGEKFRGIVGFEVPKDASDLTFVFLDQPAPISEGRALVSLGSQPTQVAVPETLSPAQPGSIHMLNEPVQLGDIVLTVNKLEGLVGNRAFQPDAGNQYVVIDFDIENKRNKSVTVISALHIAVIDNQGIQYDPDPHATSVADGQDVNGKIKAKENVHGRIGFEIPQDAKNLQFSLTLDAGKVLVQLPELPEPQKSLTQPTSAPDAAKASLDYEVPKEWAEYRVKAGLPALKGSLTDDFQSLIKECQMGIQESCDAENNFVTTIFKEPQALGTYKINACMQVTVPENKDVPAHEWVECITSVQIKPDGSMQFNFSWESKSATTKVLNQKGSDKGNKKMYLTDDLGNRYDHFEVNEPSSDESFVKATGWFVFPPGSPKATSFVFHDDDLGLKTDPIKRLWP